MKQIYWDSKSYPLKVPALVMQREVRLIFHLPIRAHHNRVIYYKPLMLEGPGNDEGTNSKINCSANSALFEEELLFERTFEEAIKGSWVLTFHYTCQLHKEFVSEFITEKKVISISMIYEKNWFFLRGLGVSSNHVTSLCCNNVSH